MSKAAFLYVLVRTLKALQEKKNQLTVERYLLDRLIILVDFESIETAT